MYRLLVIILLLLAGMDVRGQSIERPGKPYMFTQYQGVLGADSGLKAPDRLVVRPGRDSTGLMGVWNGVFYYHTGAGGGWVTPAQAGGFDSTHIYNALADSMAAARHREDSIAAMAAPLDTTHIYAAIASALEEIDGVRDSALYVIDSDLYMTQWYGAQTYLSKADFGAALDTIITFGDTADIVAPYTRVNRFIDSIAALRLVTNGKVKYTDTASMLSIYARLQALADTAGAIRGVKVNYTDTAAMLAGYVRLVAFADSINTLRLLANGKVKYTDTSGMLTPYVLGNRFTDSIALTVKLRDSLVRYATPKNVRDSAISVRAAIPTNNNQLTNGAGYITGTGVVYTTSVQTISNKRIQFRVTGGSTFTTSVAIDKDNTDVWIDSLQAGALLFAVPSGTPVDMDLLQIWVKDNGTARALTYNAVFAAGDGETLPATTILSKWLVMLFQWNARSNKYYLLTFKYFAP